MLQDSKLFAASFKRRNRLKKTFPMLLHTMCMYGSVKKLKICSHSDCRKKSFYSQLLIKIPMYVVSEK